LRSPGPNTIPRFADARCELVALRDPTKRFCGSALAREGALHVACLMEEQYRCIQWKSISDVPHRFMLSEFVDALARFAVRWRFALITFFLALTLAAGLEIPHLTVDPSPRALLASFGDQDRLAERFRRDFGSTDNVLVLLVSGRNILEKNAL